MASLNQPLQLLRVLAPSLNKATDDAARVIADIENLFGKELSLGIEASVDIHWANLAKTKTEYTRLVYRRVGGKFRIAVSVEQVTEFVNDQGISDHAGTEMSVTPWTECPRDVKLEAFAKLPALLEAMAKKAEETAQRVTDAHDAVKKLIEEIRSSDPTPQQIADWPHYLQIALAARCASIALQLLEKHVPEDVDAALIRKAAFIVQRVHAGEPPGLQARPLFDAIAARSGDKSVHNRAPVAGPRPGNRAEEIYAATTTAIVAALQTTLPYEESGAWTAYNSTLSAARAARDAQAGLGVVKAFEDVLEELKSEEASDA